MYVKILPVACFYNNGSSIVWACLTSGSFLLSNLTGLKAHQERAFKVWPFLPNEVDIA